MLGFLRALRRHLTSFVCLFLTAALLRADDPVFKSDVALSRVDAQVVDRDGRAVSGLQARDFILRVDGKVQPIKNFDSESMPIDILLLLDVSGSMRPHVERMADAARQALNVLAPQDRLAVMVFDVWARERLPFTNSRSEVTSELRHLVRSEGFNNGTRITAAMLSAANYVQKHARPDARRAIVILTDDETQDSENEPKVEKALSQAGAVLSFLEAPFDPQTVTQTSPIPGPPRIPMPGGGWPGSGGGIPGGGGNLPQLGEDHTAGTATIAEDSGGDVMPINDATSLESTLSRLRQRYALHFYMPEEAQAKTQHNIRVDLTTEARIRYPEADVRSRRVFIGGSKESSGPMVVTHQTALSDPIPGDSGVYNSNSPNQKHKRIAVNEDDAGPAGSTVGPPSQDDSATSSAPSAAAPAPATTATPSSKGGWPTAPKPQ